MALVSDYFISNAHKALMKIFVALKLPAALAELCILL